MLVGGLLGVLLWLTANWVYHAAMKPSELLFPVENSFDKTPAATWKQYGALFEEHSTAVISPEFLAALAQSEGGGNPVARTYWRWQVTWNPFEVYQPASSAVGMFQMTDGTFQQAKRYCIHDHRVVTEGPWHDVKSCWFNSLYTRIVPSHAIEMTSALLDREVTRAIRGRTATRLEKQNLAAVIHLCGAAAGQAYAARRFRLVPGQRCGDHDVSAYLARVNKLTRLFAALAATSGPQSLL
ncbi:MAG TPA: lytic transglycosylase domain-containing protein [Nitrospira sp.]|nr:lytic transglycosylase domain-containing protein [Nitrospira sp.]